MFKKILTFCFAIAAWHAAVADGPVVQTTPFSRGLLKAPDTTTARNTLGVLATNNWPVTNLHLQGPTSINPTNIGGVNSNGIFIGPQISNTSVNGQTNWAQVDSEFTPTNQQIYYPGIWPHVQAGALNPSSGLFPTLSGSAATLEDLPVTRESITQLQPGPQLFVTLNVGGGDDDGHFDTNVTQTVLTNFIAANLLPSGLVQSYAAAGIPTTFWLDMPWNFQNRTNGNNLAFDPFKFPASVGNQGWFANYLHTNGLLASVNLYFSIYDITNDYVVFSFYSPPNQVLPMMTGYTIRQDITNLMAMGIDSLVVADLTPQEGYYNRMVRMVDNAVLFPMGNYSYSDDGISYARPMTVNFYHVDTTTQPQDNEFANSIWNDQFISVPSIYSSNHLSLDMYQLRWIWTNQAPYVGKGHYGEIFQFYGAPSLIQNQEDLATAVALGRQIDFGPPTNLISHSDWMSYCVTPLTNTLLQSAMFVVNPLQQIYDNGGNGNSAWYRDLPGGKKLVLIAAEGAASSVGFNFSAIGSSAMYDVKDVWSFTDYGVFSGAYTNSEGHAGYNLLILSPAALSAVPPIFNSGPLIIGQSGFSPANTNSLGLGFNTFIAGAFITADSPIDAIYNSLELGQDHNAGYGAIFGSRRDAAGNPHVVLGVNTGNSFTSALDIDQNQNLNILTISSSNGTNLITASQPYHPLATNLIGLPPWYRAGLATNLNSASHFIQVTFSTPLPSTNYSVTATAGEYGDANTTEIGIVSNTVNGFTLALNNGNMLNPESYFWIALMRQ